MTPRRTIGVRLGRRALSGSPLCFLLFAWESYMTPSCTAKHFFIAIHIRVKILNKHIMILVNNGLS